MKKSILFDGTCISPGNSGVGNYAQSLLQGLNRYRNELEIHLLARPDSPVEGLATAVHYVGPNSNRLRKMLPWDCFGFGDQYSLLHEPNFVPQRFSGPTIVTVHDLTVFLFPGLHPFRRVCWANLFRRRMIRADRILTVSNHSKKDIIDFFGVSPDKVAVTYLGSPLHLEAVDGPDEESRVLAAMQIREPYILSVGTLEPRKNIPRLVAAYAMFCRQPEGKEVSLVLAGGKGWLGSGLERQIAECGLNGRVTLTGYVGRRELSVLYRRAMAFAYPSLYEGFGLPPLEAMAHGIPVIVSACSSLPEVVGDAGIQVNPASTEELAAALLQVASSGSLRDQMRAKGIARAALFSWDRCAEQTLAAYREVMG